jgi:hypothetical protein
MVIIPVLYSNPARFLFFLVVGSIGPNSQYELAGISKPLTYQTVKNFIKCTNFE